ncbi:DUF3265 domain-containing protein [Vibrio cyclitrophicus]|nr:DUF3265 domain-containing protein [Vibrio cyclitrophicus]
MRNARYVYCALGLVIKMVCGGDIGITLITP